MADNIEHTIAKIVIGELKDEFKWIEEKLNSMETLLPSTIRQGDIDGYTIVQDNNANQLSSEMSAGNVAQALIRLEVMGENVEALENILNAADTGELTKLNFDNLDFTATSESLNQMRTSLELLLEISDEDLMSVFGVDSTAIREAIEYLKSFSTTMSETSKTVLAVKDEQAKDKHWLKENTGILKGALDEIGKNTSIVEQIYTGQGDAAVTAMSAEIIKFAQLRSMKLMVDGTYYAAMAIIDRDGALLEDGIPYSVKAAHAFATAAALGAFSYAAVQGGEMETALYGKAHDGFDSIPYEGTWLLDKGERVVDSRTNADLKQFLSGKSRGDINLTVNINGGDKDSVMEALPALQKIIEDVVVGNIVSGGKIKRVIKEYR